MIPLLLGGALAGKLILDQYTAEKQRRYQDRLVADEKQQARKAALERAMTGKYSPGPFSMGQLEVRTPPDMTKEAIAKGLLDIAALYGGRT